MKVSELILANRTHGLSNHPCVSSEDNALVSESWGRTGGLASGGATTRRVVRPNGIVSSAESCAHMNAVCGMVRCAEPVATRRRPCFQASFGRMHLGVLRRIGSLHRHKDWCAKQGMSVLYQCGYWNAKCQQQLRLGVRKLA